MKRDRFVVAVFLMMVCMMMASPVHTAETTDTVGVPAINDQTAEDPAANNNGVVSLDFENADLKSVLKAFSMQTGINFIASDIIEDKKITVFLSNVSIEAALVSILEANGLQYEKQAGNVYLIKPTGKGNIKTVTKIFKLNYLQVYKMAEALGATGSTSTISIIVPASSTSQTAMTPSDSSSSTAAIPAAGGQGGSAAAAQAKSILDIITSLMSKYGVIVADRRNNCLIITDIPDVFESIEETLKKLDVEPIQIFIQAEIIETTTSALKRIGMEYGSEDHLLKASYTGSSNTTSGDANVTNPTFPTPFPFSQSFLKKTYGASLQGSDLFSYGTISISTVDFVLKMLSLDSDTKFLSRPNIMTINNEPAIIKVSANQAIGVNNTSVSTTGQSISTAERAETGVILKVTPQVNDKGDIFMFLEPSVSRTVPSGLSTSYLDPSYRTSASTVMVRDLETVVVAGLIQTTTSQTDRKIPFIGDIPILGEAFKSRGKQVQETELLIFVTPHIVRLREAEYVTPPGQTNRDYMMQRAMDRYVAKEPQNNGNAKKAPYAALQEGAIKRDDMMTKVIQKYSNTASVAGQK